jgi:hypothetical protein
MTHKDTNSSARKLGQALMKIANVVFWVGIIGFLIACGYLTFLDSGPPPQ